MAYFKCPTQTQPIVDDAIYGAEWAGTSDPSWTRTDAAANFLSNPNPYYSSMSGNPSSPCDTISPWKDMKIVEDSEAGTLVEIPKFYYKWTRDSAKMKLQISMTQHTDFLCSPAHMDRGDGAGERDKVYVGRYHCASDYKSKSLVLPAVSITRANFRNNIHNLGTKIWQWDYAMLWTIRMLYLVEFAHWNSQEKIGYGGGNGSSTQAMGSTDNMGYHTGTHTSSRTTYGHTQYRYIEGLWDNVYDWCDGIYFAGTNNNNVYCIKNPASFSDTSGGTKVGTRSTLNRVEYVISGWTNPSGSYKYALYPNNYVNDSTYTTYVCDSMIEGSSNTNYGEVLYVGADYSGYDQGSGLFRSRGNLKATASSTYIGSRLMKLP